MRTKGERLKWMPLKEVKKVNLCLFAYAGREVTKIELDKVNHSKHSILVP